MRQDPSFMARATGTLRARAFRTLMALGLLSVSALSMASACGSDTTTRNDDGPDEPVQTCEGGYVTSEGACEGKCTPDKCLAGNTCVGNRCVLKCDSHLDCYIDSQECAPAEEDDTKAAISVCKFRPADTGIGIKCYFGNECETRGLCPDGKACDLGQCGGNPEACVKDEAACGEATNCSTGKCPDSTPCTVNPCAAAQCAPMTCITTAVGDADAYCTKQDCTADEQCPGGYYCGVTRDPHEVCGSSNPTKGNNTLCGETDEPCIAPADLAPASGQLAKDGTTRFEGSLCILRRTCLKRNECAPCAADLDCSQFADSKCVDVGDGTKGCARSCNPANADKDCGLDYECVEGACKPRFKACKGAGNFCEPCRNDTDCGDASTTKVCRELSGGQRVCFDESFPDACTVDDPNNPYKADTECPKAPGGKNGTCVELNSGTACYLPYNTVKDKYSCW